jgi:hypothetical protein
VLDPISLASAALLAAPTVAVAYAAFRSWRARRRNLLEACGDCRGPLYAPRAADGPALVQGRLVCDRCSETRRRRVRRSLVGAACIGGCAVLVMAGAALSGSLPWIFAVAVAGQYAALFGGALTWMGFANRRAASRLPAGTVVSGMLLSPEPAFESPSSEAGATRRQAPGPALR